MVIDDMSFNLIEVPWIECRELNGQHAMVSIRQILGNPDQYVALEGDSPQQDYALMRLLLVILWRSQVHSGSWNGSGDDLYDWWLDAYAGVNLKEVTSEIMTYLDAHLDRFDLCDSRTPFMQVATLHTANNTWSSVRRLVPDSESTYFTMRAGREAEMMPLYEAARWLIACQAWDYSGIKSGAVGDSRVKGGKGYPIGTGWCGRTGGVLLRGANLWESLILNTVPHLVKNIDDRPVWERVQYTESARGDERADGPSDLLTWQSRRIRLQFEDGQVSAVLVCNGDRIAPDNNFDDPMSSYRFSPTQSKKQGKDVYFPRPWDRDLCVWYGAQAILAGGVPLPKGQKGNDGKPVPTLEWLADIQHEEGKLSGYVSVDLVGYAYGQQDSVIETGVFDTVPVWMEVLKDSTEEVALTVTTTVQRTIDAGVLFGQFVGNLRYDRGGEYVFDAEVKENLLRDLTSDFTQWVGSLRLANLVSSRDSWYSFVERSVLGRAQVYLHGAGPRAMTGRIDADGRLHSAAVSYRTLSSQLRKKLERSTDSTAAKGDQ